MLKSALMTGATGKMVPIYRLFNHTGSGQASSYAASSFTRQMARIECEPQPPVIKIGNLDNRRDFLNVRDVVDAYAHAALPAAR